MNGAGLHDAAVLFEDVANRRDRIERSRHPLDERVDSRNIDVDENVDGLAVAAFHP